MLKMKHSIKLKHSTSGSIVLLAIFFFSIAAFQAIQRNGYGDALLNGPKSSWLGYSLLPKGIKTF